MKNVRTRLFILAAFALALAACTRDERAEGTLPAGEYPVIIQANGLDVTATPVSRATVDGDWQGVNSVALQIGDEVKEYTVTATDADGYQSATLSRTADPFYWTSRNDTTVSAWWPLNDTDITQMPDVKVAADQSKLTDFQNSDFISAENQTVEFDDPTLEFTHRTARVVVELKPGTGFTSVAGATVSLVNLSDDNGNPTAIQTYHASGNTHEALVLPQNVAGGNPFIRVELGSGTFYFRPQKDVSLEAGNRYTYTVIVNATGLTLEGSTIGDWADGGGEEGEAEDLGYIYDEATHTYFVYNAKGLLAWNEAVQSDLTLNCTLTADITLPAVDEGESNWTYVGYDYDSEEFVKYDGTFEGGGHTITGLTVNLPGQNNVGLIGYLGNGGKVQNLTLAEVEITGNSNVGGVAGTNESGTVTACTVSGKVSGNWNVGGVAGTNESGTVTGCTVSGNVSGSNSWVGGMVGNNYGTVTACYHAVGNVSGNQYVGGVVGNNYATVTACYWNNSLATGIGTGTGTGEATKVDGSTETWQTAQSGMNDAIDAWNKNNPDKPCNWHYAETDATTPPTLEPIND